MPAKTTFRSLAVGYGIAATLTILLATAPAWTAPAWTFVETEITGTQLDAVPGPDGKIHVMSSRYQVLNTDGTLASFDERLRDGGQDMGVFPPAIGVGPEGTVHVVSREGGGYSLNKIHYFRLSPEGALGHYIFGTRCNRNYIVGVAAADASNAFMHHTESFSNVWGDVHVWRDNGSAGQKLGSLSGIWRSDTDVRMRGHNGTLYLVSGLPDRNGKVSFSWADVDGNVFSQLESNMQAHKGGTGGDKRRGFPDLYIDKTGSVHLTYGCQIGQILYNRYSSSHSKAFSADKLVMSNMGEWHLSIGISAVAASDDGEKVVVVGALYGSELGEQLMWVYSTDGGSTWSNRASLDKLTACGEGRRRPRLVAAGDAFYLIYFDKETGKVAMGILSFGGGTATSRPAVEHETPHADVTAANAFAADIALATAERVSMRVVDATGREIARRDCGLLPRGTHRVSCRETSGAGELATGVYVVQVKAGETMQSRAIRMVTR